MLFTKRDKRTKLEKEIEVLLDQMGSINSTRNDEIDELESAISEILREMEQCPKKSKEYTDMARNVNTLMEAKATIKYVNQEYMDKAECVKILMEAQSKKKDFDWGTLAVIGGNLLGIVLILKHEQLNIITSKAIGFVLRGRV